MTHRKHRVKKVKSSRSKSLFMIAIMVMIAVTMVTFNDGSSKNVKALPFIYDILESGSEQTSVIIPGDSNIEMVLLNKSEEPLYWEIYEGRQAEGDCLEGGTAVPYGEVRKIFDRTLNQGTYTFLLYENGHSRMNGSLEIQLSE